MGNTQAISFWNFLTQHSIEIPIIQRDYAQGRKGKEELRKGFLTNLKEALDNTNKKLKLDFVYGAEKNGLINPLDGQQRLTTLWLFHWYIALRAGKLYDASKILKKFTYETRVTSREFCKELCTPENFNTYVGNNIVEFITNQTWFYSAWKQDPTIQSMLRMLSGSNEINKQGVDFIDGIEELFACPIDCNLDLQKKTCALKDMFSGYWTTLSGDNCPIVFYYLPLKDFGLSDDLYIKMNARGKQLTSFENFKADLIGYIYKQEDTEWKTLLDPQKGIPIKMDTSWTDIFWKNRSSDNKIDEIYFAFINRLFWNELFIAKDENKNYILDIGKGNENSTREFDNQSYRYLNNDLKIQYKGLDYYKYYKGEIPKSFFDKLVRILDNYHFFDKYHSIPECCWDKNFKFIPEYVKDEVTSLIQVQRIVFFAICKFFDHDNQIKDTETSLKQWMRVVWNLVSGEDQNGRQEIRSTSAMRTAIEFLDSLNPHDVYTSLKESYIEEKLGNSSFDRRCKEEIIKAKKIINAPSWEQKFVEEEEYAFFKGSICFLYTDDNGDINWDDFDTKRKNIHRFIDSKGETIKSLIPYLNDDDDIREIFSDRNLSEDDNNLRVLFQKYPTKVHYFLKQENEKEKLSLLQKELMLLCKNCQAYWIHKEWINKRDVLSNYSNRSGYYEVVSYYIGEEHPIIKLLSDMSDNSITIKNDIQECENHKILKGLFVNFTYKRNEKVYYFRWRTDDIVEMYDKDWTNNLGKTYAYYNKPGEETSFTDVTSFKEQLDRCCDEYDKI